MSKQHFFPLFVGDFLASTATWEGEERALYMLLLAYQWSSGPLPTEPKKLARMCQYDPKTFTALWKTVGPKFVEQDGGLVNERLEQHRVRSIEISNKRSGIGTKGGQASAAKRQAKREQAEPQEDSKDEANASVLLNHPLRSDPIRDPVDTSDSTIRAVANSAREDLRAPGGGKAAGKPSEHEHHEAFLRVQAAYPRAYGAVDWLTAERNCRRLVEAWHATWPDLESAAARYAAFVAGGGVGNPRCVTHPQRFFDPDSTAKPWAADWAIPQAAGAAVPVRQRRSYAELLAAERAKNPDFDPDAPPQQATA